MDNYWRYWVSSKYKRFLVVGRFWNCVAHNFEEYNILYHRCIFWRKMMGFFEKLDKDFNNIYNNIFTKQDLNYAKELADIYLQKNPKNEYKFYIEALFLGQSDRTASHPYFVKAIKNKPSLIENFFGFQGGKINWEYDNNFRLNDYTNSNWFHSVLESYSNEKGELLKSKELYIKGNISFFDYFIKRLSVYDTVKQKDHIRHYEGVNREKYIELLRSKLRLIIR